MQNSAGGLHLIFSLFKRQAVLLVGVAAVSQILQLISYLALTRNFAPLQLGAFGQVHATFLLFLPWAALAFPSALALAKTSVERDYLSRLALLATIGSAAVVQMFFWLYAIFGHDLHSMFLYAPFISIVGAGLASLAEQQFLLAGRIKQQALVVLSVATCICCSRILLALNEASLPWLLATVPLQPVLLAGFYYVFSKRSTSKQQYRWTELKRIGQNFSNFPKYQASQQAFNAWSQSIPLILFSWWFGLDVLAYLNLAILLLAAPSGLLNKAVGDVYYPLAASLLQQSRGLIAFLAQTTAALFFLLILPFSLLGIYAEPLYANVFGEQWRHAADYCLWLMPWYFLVCLNAPALKTLIVMRQQKFSFYLNVCTFVLRCLAITIGAFVAKSVWWAIALYSVIGCMHNLIIIGNAFVVAKRHAQSKEALGDAVC